MLILCCGHLSRGDAAAGLLVAQRLNAMAIPAQALSGEAFSLMEAWRDCDQVILVNAVATGAPHGTVNLWDGVNTELPGRWFRCSNQFLGVGEAIAMSRANGTLPRGLLVYGIEGRYFEPGSRPSAQVLRAVDQVAGEIASEAAVIS
jgi:hydrogenase maturation protease